MSVNVVKAFVQQLKSSINLSMEIRLHLQNKAERFLASNHYLVFATKLKWNFSLNLKSTILFTLFY